MGIGTVGAENASAKSFTPVFAISETCETDISEDIYGFVVSGCMFDTINRDDYIIDFGTENPRSRGFFTETLIPVSEIGDFVETVYEKDGSSKPTKK